MSLQGLRGPKFTGTDLLPHFSNVASANLEKVNGHHVDHSTHLESYMNPPCVQIKGVDVDKTAHSVSSPDSVVGQKHMGLRAREGMAADSTYTMAQRIHTTPADDHGLFADSTKFVTVNQLGWGENGAHQEVSLETIASDLPQPTQLQSTDLKPLSDAPITGAPIRLFRFVARYVSGADLVNNNEH
ncbi:hypothetical protein L7F22_033938 [Adiantum nelumboides]|nr:hypothetical protein [Adiantum nelumboides]